MVTWAEFNGASPELAASGRRLLYRGQTGEALLATVRGDAPPRIHPIWVAIVEGRLYAFIQHSAKRTDLERDGRFALHTHIDPAAPSEFSIRGHAHLVDAPEVRSATAGQWAFEVDETYDLFEFSVEFAVLGSRATADDWPPLYTLWKATP